jgi:thioredoxin-dependent peroxiredoxin
MKKPLVWTSGVVVAGILVSGIFLMQGGESHMVNVGQAAPDFALQASNGTAINLSDFRGKKSVVLFFYPKDDSPGCTREACSFRDAYSEFSGADVEVLGINSGDLDSHQKFAAKQHLQFPLLVDADDRVRAAYGVSKTAGIIPGRVTFLIDKTGLVRARFSSQFGAAQHVDEMKVAIRSLRQG